jgi:5-methylcytosine-specific restriction endonuclease McrA
MTQKYRPGWNRRRALVLKRDGGVCQLCGGDGADTVDHIVPVVAGGSDAPEGLRAAHRACNSRRGAAGHRKARRVTKRDLVPVASVSSRWA